jgi:L-alanine-DL-glutamate epimerase-like enolase superfamily enzyme
VRHQIDSEVFNISGAQIRVLEPVATVIPFQDSSMGPFHTFGLSVIRLTDEDGNTGEAPVHSSYTNILEKCFFPILFYNHNISYKDLYHKLYWSIRNEGFRGQASALLGQLDMALYDIAARRKQMPLHRYLNANRNEVKIYGSGGGTNYSCKELEKEVGFFLERGVNCYKMKVGKDFGTKMNEDVERVKFVRKLIGKDVKLALDANQIWTYDQALAFIDQVEDQDIEWLEEPIHSAALSEIAQLCKKSSIKISYGESERTSKVFPALVNAGVKHVQPVPTHLCSIKEWMEVKELARQAGTDFSAGGYSLYTASLMSTAAENCRLEYLYSIMHGLEQYFVVCPQWVDGKFILPEIEGLPVRIDWDYCNKKNKIIKTYNWSKDKMTNYAPTVSI